MKSSSCLKLRRRDFLAASSSLLALGTGFLGSCARSARTSPRGPDLPEELSPEELEIVQRSVMGTDFPNFFGQDRGYSCAESSLIVGLRYMERPEELVWAAGGFGGGLGKEDLCGLLTGGVMSIGFFVGTLELERKEAKKVSRKMVNEYWEWWTSMAPLHCREILEGREDYKVCHRLGKLAMARLEKFIAPAG